MANPKSLGMNQRPNARPVTSVNQRPAAAPAQSGVSSQGRQVVIKTPPVREVPPTGFQRRPAPAPAPQQAQPGATKAMRQKVPTPPKADPQARAQKKADAAAELVAMLRDMVGGFAILSNEVLNKNMEMMMGKGMTYDDRTISFECADYVISNLAYIFMGLVLDKNFKDSFLDALNVELQIDSQPPNVKAQTRKQMKDTKSYESTGSLVLGVTTFVPAIGAQLIGKMQAGFAKLDPFSAEFDAEVAKMSDEEKVQLGYIFSNFMYLIRAFTHNDMFMSYVITVIEKVKSITSGQG